MINESLRNRLEKINARLTVVEQELANPEVTKNIKKFQALSIERAELLPIVERARSLDSISRDIETAESWTSDPELKDDAVIELDGLRKRVGEVENELKGLLLPKDPNDKKNVLLEIRAGTGGDESTLFAADLVRMYTKFAERKKWKIEILSSHESGLGGFKEIVLKLTGKNVYSTLKFESGGHRVQRIPITETQGRIHTSACTVAVLAEVENISEINVKPEEIRVDVFRASGAGGQHVNKTESAVRITHLPTGIVAECQDDRSQHKNKDKALKVLCARIKDQELASQQKSIADTRKTLIGSGDRSERIRTYNFPQGRVTDHRINLTSYKLDQVLEGILEEFTDMLVAQHQAERLSSMVD